MCGETGASPVRARRRDVRFNTNLTSLPQEMDKVIEGVSLEKTDLLAQSRKTQHQNAHHVFQVPQRVPVFWRENNMIFKGEKQMKTTNKNLCLSLILCLVLIAAMALMTVGCTDNNQQESPAASADTSAVTDATTNVATPTGTGDETISDITVKGEGDTMFYFNVVDGEGNVTKFEIHTNETTVGAALLALELIDGEDGAYGLYVKSVNGITADYDTSGTWWEFCVGDESSMTGVDLTTIEAGATYAFRVSE